MRINSTLKDSIVFLQKKKTEFRKIHGKKSGKGHSHRDIFFK